MPPGRYQVRVVTPRFRPLLVSVVAPAADLRVVMPVPLVRGFSVRIRQKAPTIDTTRRTRIQEFDPLELCDLGISASRDRVFYLQQPLPPAKISPRGVLAQLVDLLRSAGLWARDR